MMLVQTASVGICFLLGSLPKSVIQLFVSYGEESDVKSSLVVVWRAMFPYEVLLLSGYPYHSPETYLDYFRATNITTIVRLNMRMYDARK